MAGLLLLSTDIRAADDLRNGKHDEPATAAFPKRDATSDPLLLLLRAPVIHRELGLQQGQIESIEKVIGEVDEPLWRLRDVQFLNAENSKKAWQLIDQVDLKLGGILERDQQARFRQLLIQARGFDALLTTEVIKGLNLSTDQVRQIAGVFEETRKETQRLQKESAGKAEKLLTSQRKKIVALLTDAQKRQFQNLAGDSYDFGRLPRRFARAPEIRGVEDWINSAPLSLAELRGKVVALHFFTFSCINCVHNQPAYKDWYGRFSGQDVVVLGIQTPEGDGDRIVDNIRKALQQQEIKYPVAIDNRKENWTTWANNMWPAVYLIDKQGYVRYWWYGELNWQGAQGEKLFCKRISDLLAETDEPSRRVDGGKG
ncbi:MAG: redoxin domain-containing protein [Pirellulales bacterium]|nr:redoxin domain-containing protein [Pirellulales bacterium]